jgi:FHA domain
VQRLADRSDVMQRPPRAPLPPRSRRRWLAAACVAVLWALFVRSAGSVAGGTVLLAMILAAVIGLVLALRYLGINSGHPWVQHLAARPWRDGRDVLRLGLRHLPEVLIVTPSGSLLAPNHVELQMNPGDFASLTEMMDIDLINSSATEVYQSQITGHAAGLASPGPGWVSVIGDPAVPAGRYRLRPGRPVSPAPPPDRFAGDVREGRTNVDLEAHQADRAARADRSSRADRAGRVDLAGPAGPSDHADRAAAATFAAGSATVSVLAPVPLLRLVTRGIVTETRISGARAGRAAEAELRLPEVPTVSRLHAELTFIDGLWRITNLGRNGLTLNGRPLADQQAIRDGDSIGWGTQPGALVSRVEIGWDRPLPAHEPR